MQSSVGLCEALRKKEMTYEENAEGKASAKKMHISNRAGSVKTDEPLRGLADDLSHTEFVLAALELTPASHYL
jgi:hypothetical protein